MILGHRLILLATPRQIGVLDWRPGRMHWLGEFAADAAGLAAFRKVVVRHAHLPALLVVDSVDEDYRSEILPHVQGQPRAELVARKLKQVFRNARFTGAWRQGRETAGRRDDRYLMAALTDNDWLMPWVSVLHREQVPLAGITPLAQACQHLLAKLRGAAEPHILLAYRLNNSLRLSYYHHGQLRFSRLIASDTPTQLPTNAADEIGKTQLYLVSQRILPRESRLHVLLIDPSGQLDSAEASLNADPAFSARLVDLPHLARALRIPDAFLAATPEIAPLAAIAPEPVHLNLAPAELLERHTEFRWRRGLAATAGVIALAGLTLTAGFWLHARDLGDQAANMADERRQIEARYRVMAQAFPIRSASPEQLAQTVALARRLDAPMPSADALLATVGQALVGSPDIVLEQIQWTDDTLVRDGGTRIELDAALAPFDGNYRFAMQRIRDFMRTLEADPAVHDVRMLTSPVNADSSSTLAGKTSNGETGQPQAAAFSVALIYREAHP